MAKRRRSASSPPAVPDQQIEGQIDYFSALPDHILLIILSFLPTHVAARTSVLSRRFRPLWKASPRLHFDFFPFVHRPFHFFLEMVNRSFLHRDPFSPVLDLTLHLKHLFDSSLISTLLDKASSFRIRHLTIELSFEMADHYLTTILSIPSLESLSFQSISIVEEPIPTSSIAPTGLRRLSLCCISIETPILNNILSKLPVLEDLELGWLDSIDLSSQIIRRLKVDLSGLYTDARICTPSLESLDFYNNSQYKFNDFQGEMPLVQTAVIKIERILENSASAIYDLLKAVTNVETLFVEIEEDWDRGKAFHTLAAPDMDSLIFPNLKRLELRLCFHDYNMENLVSVLQHSPVIETLKLYHKLPYMHSYRKVKKPIESKLPRNKEGNNERAFFDLHIEKNKKELMKRLTRITSKRQIA